MFILTTMSLISEKRRG